MLCAVFPGRCWRGWQAWVVAQRAVGLSGSECAPSADSTAEKEQQMSFSERVPSMDPSEVWDEEDSLTNEGSYSEDSFPTGVGPRWY